ncbi:MAG: apolipoprotein N-acyltransferase [Myxococcota bacterium]
MGDERKDRPEEGAPASEAATTRSASEAPPSEGTHPPSGTAAPFDPHPIVTPRVAWGLTAVSAVLCPLGFAGFDVWPLAFIAWVPLILALRGQPARRALALGWGAGFGMTMIGFWWLTSMLEEFSGFPMWACVGMAALLCVQKGGRIALLGWLYARMAGRGWHSGVSFVGAFAVSELVYPLLFPWYYGASMHTVPVMMQTADLGGPIAVSLVVVTFNVAVAELLVRPVFRRAPDRRTLLFAAVAPAALVYGLARIAATDAAIADAEALKVGMVQGATPLKKRTNALRVHVDRTKALAAEGVDLVVWSEAAASRNFDSKSYEAAVKRRITRHLGVPSIVGTVVYERIPNPGPKGRRARFFNTALIADAEGTVKGRYDKQFLLMFGEYLPLGERFPVLYEWSPNSGQFTPGTSFDPLPFGEHRISTMICYEDIIPSFVSELVKVGDPDLLVNMTNDAWFGDTVEPWQHLALAKFRSIEHRLFMVRVTNTGVSAIIDPVGRTPVVMGVDFTTPHTATGTVRFLRLFTLYKKLGDVPWWIVSALCALAAFVRKRR